MDVLKKQLNFLQYKNKSCLLKRTNKNRSVYLRLYVDNCFIIGDKTAVKKALDNIQKSFDIKRSEKVFNLIGFIIKKEKDRVLLS